MTILIQVMCVFNIAEPINPLLSDRVTEMSRIFHKAS